MQRHTVQEWQELSALYEQADELDDTALESWLGQLHEQAHPLLPQLERMLRARTQVRKNDFLAEPPKILVSPSSDPSDWVAGNAVGPYELERPLGSGGMAEVWLAKRVDGAFERQVAIKLLYREAGRARRSGFLQRFERERNILASLNHRNIAKLLDAGVTASHQPWIALEYVQGRPLTDWCDQHTLDVRERVRLFQQVLLAVQYAHSNLVIHRDIKPANILVTEQGQAQLLDFGIAKILEAPDKHSTETELTQIAGRPLTLLYASPEQTRGEPLTTASDVYSLGVVLYQLVCGETPYELKRESAAQLEQAIHEAEPRAPSRRSLGQATAQNRRTTPKGLQRELSNDLDAIVLKALRKAPDQRYGSVEALNTDLQRWLDGLAVQAKAPSTAYYLRKFVARHSVSVSLGLAALVSLVLGATVAIYMGLQAREQGQRATASRDFLIGMFRQADPDRTGGRQLNAGELLATAKASLLNRTDSQTLLRAELLHGLGLAQHYMGQYKLAAQTLMEALQIYRQINATREATSATLDLASTISHAGDSEAAKALLDQVDASGALPGQPVRSQEVYYAVRGALAVERADWTAARTATQRSLDLSQKLSEAEGRTANSVLALNMLSAIESQADNYQGAADYLVAATKQLEASPEAAAASWANLKSSQAELELAFGHYALASQLYASAVGIC